MISRKAVWGGVVALILVPQLAAAQFRDASAVVDAVNRDYPGLINSGHPCGAFVDQVAHRLNRQDHDRRWGRKARQADGGNPNCDGLTYLNEPSDESRKVIVDIIANGPDVDRDDPNARPAWQVFAGDNVGNGFWTPPVTADRDVDVPDEPDTPPPSSPDAGVDVAQLAEQLHALEERLNARFDALEQKEAETQQQIRDVVAKAERNAPGLLQVLIRALTFGMAGR